MSNKTNPMGLRGWLIHRPFQSLGIALVAVSATFSYQFMVESTFKAGLPLLALAIMLSPLFLAYGFYKSMKTRPVADDEEGGLNE